MTNETLKKPMAWFRFWFDLVCSRLIGLVRRVFANGPGDLGSIPGYSYQRLKKWFLIPPCLSLSNIRYISKVKWSNPGKGVAPSPTPRCSCYWKGSLLVDLVYGRQLYFGISTIFGYSLPIPVFTYISNIWFVNSFCRYTELNGQTVLFLTIQFRIR